MPAHVPLHGRDHCPTGADPIPCLQQAGFHANITTNFSVVNNANAILAWEQWTTDDSSVFQDGDIVADKLENVKCMKNGWYAIHCWVRWNAGWTGDHSIMMIHDDTDVEEGALTQAAPRGTGQHLSEMMVFQVVRFLPPVYYVAGAGLNNDWADKLEFWVAQVSGSSRDVDRAYLNIAYLGSGLADPTIG